MRNAPNLSVSRARRYRISSRRTVQDGLRFYICAGLNDPDGLKSDVEILPAARDGMNITFGPSRLSTR